MSELKEKIVLEDIDSSGKKVIYFGNVERKKTKIYVTNNSGNENLEGSLPYCVKRANEDADIDEIVFVDNLEDVTGKGRIIELTSNIPDSPFAQLRLLRSDVHVKGNKSASIKNMVTATRTIYSGRWSNLRFEDYNLALEYAASVGYGGFSNGNAVFNNCFFNNIQGSTQMFSDSCSFNNCYFQDCSSYNCFIRSNDVTKNCIFIRCYSLFGINSPVDSCYFEDMERSVLWNSATVYNSTFVNTGTSLRYLKANSLNETYILINCNIVNYGFSQNNGVYNDSFVLYGCTMVQDNNTMIKIGNVEMYNCLLVKKQPGNIFHADQRFSGSQNIYLSDDLIDSEVATKYCGEIDDLIDLQIRYHNLSIKYYKPKGIAVGFCENLKDEDWKLSDIRGHMRGNTTDAGAYATEAI